MGIFLDGANLSPVNAGRIPHKSPTYRTAVPGYVMPQPLRAPAVASAEKPKVPDRGNHDHPFISEMVVGGWLHDPGEQNGESNTWDFNIEILFRKLTLYDAGNRFVKFLLSPRPSIGGSINNENETHTAYLGMNWAYQFRNGLFLSFFLGGTYHTGNKEQATRQCAVGEGCSLPGNRAFVPTGKPKLGSQFLFREGLDVGYRFGRHGVPVFASHLSNAGIDNDNDGMNFVGVRYSFSMDSEFWN